MSAGPNKVHTWKTVVENCTVHRDQPTEVWSPLTWCFTKGIIYSGWGIYRNIFATYLLVKTWQLQQMQWFYETYSKLFQVVLSCVVGDLSTWSEPQIQMIKVKSAQPHSGRSFSGSFFLMHVHRTLWSIMIHSVHWLMPTCNEVILFDEQNHQTWKTGDASTDKIGWIWSVYRFIYIYGLSNENVLISRV